jgi:hypothetical protein
MVINNGTFIINHVSYHYDIGKLCGFSQNTPLIKITNLPSIQFIDGENPILNICVMFNWEEL